MLYFCVSIMRKSIVASVLSVQIKLFLAIVLFAFTTTSAKANQLQPAVDVVFTIDLSGSTNGAIDDLRDKIWDINNQLNYIRPNPNIRFGVVAYGRPSFGVFNNFVKVIVPLTKDVDLITDEIFKIRPNVEKGEQFVGAALRASIELMNWSTADNATKIIYLVGNGTVNMGAFDFREAYEMARKNNIVINSLYCYSELRFRDYMGWKEIAEETGGEVTDIKIHKRLPEFTTVDDLDKLKSLAKQLSSTYVYYGKPGFNRYKMMTNIDRSALESGQATFEAMLYYKISDGYQGKQSDWDLVDYIKEGRGNLSEINPEFLSDSLKKFNPEQLRNRLVQLKEKRTRIINHLRELLPYERQSLVNKFNEGKEDEGGMVLERVVMTSLFKKLKEKGIVTQ